MPHIIYDFTPSSVAKKLSREMALLDTYPIMMPMMSNITLFLTIVEKRKMMPVTAIAPMKELSSTATNPANV